MSGAKGNKLTARIGKDRPRKHYCPECKGKEDLTPKMEMKPVLLYPRKRLVFKCPVGHVARRGRTVLL